ncbi:MAG: TIGR04282 family arsenosugar biosynthesis glycosyltransferase [Rhodospirillaceae bacterium]|nr:TIGR04282 family arsenosugar biosynthesis glycosyltransferase [Rhodospirillaceae bacterium]
MAQHLIVFVKEPLLGKVKTRLARDIGAAAALRFYEQTLHATILRLAAGPWRCRLAVAPDDFARRARRRWRWLPHRVEIVPQGAGDLGVRMARALRQVPPGPAVLIGSDIPGIAPAHIRRAFAALGGCDAVFGPAEDGGYWLVGQRRLRPLPGLFRAVRWSSPQALADTLANLRPGQSHRLVARLADVDDGASYRRIGSPLPRVGVTL